MLGPSQAGAPLMHRTAIELASLQQRLAVTDGLFSMSSSIGQAPGSIRYINDVDTQLRLLSGEARLMEASGEWRKYHVYGFLIRGFLMDSSGTEVDDNKPVCAR